MTSSWREQIQDALSSGSEARMRETYRTLIDELGAEDGGRLWLEVISAWDHSAVTG